MRVRLRLPRVLALVSALGSLRVTQYRVLCACAAKISDAYDIASHVTSRCGSITAPVFVEGVLDWKEWLAPSLCDLKGHTGVVGGVATGNPHGFHLYAGGDGKPVMEYSDAPGAREPVWRGNGGVVRGEAGFEPIRVLREVPDGVPARATTIWLESDVQAGEAAAAAHFEHDRLQLGAGAGAGAAVAAEVRWRFDVLHTGLLQIVAAPPQRPAPVLADAGVVRKPSHPDLEVPTFDGNLAGSFDALWGPLEARRSLMAASSPTPAPPALGGAAAPVPQQHAVIISSGNSSAGGARAKSERKAAKRSTRGGRRCVSARKAGGPAAI